jgi:hypothetical protein
MRRDRRHSWPRNGRAATRLRPRGEMGSNGIEILQDTGQTFGRTARVTRIAWAAKQADEPSRSEAIRRLVELGLKAKGK